jgi:hypothetical protein
MSDDWLILTPGETHEEPSGRRHTDLLLHTQMRGTRAEAEAERQRVQEFFPDGMVALVHGQLEYPNAFAFIRDLRLMACRPIDLSERALAAARFGGVK